VGRTTPSYRMAVYRELERIRRTIRYLPRGEAEYLESLLEGIEETITAYLHVSPPPDPFEVIVLHMLRRAFATRCFNMVDEKR